MAVQPHIVVVGAGIIGANVARGLVMRGARVTVLDQGPIGGVASANSFGWINASFAESDAYFKLRSDAVQAFRTLSQDIDLSAHVRWDGTLWWEDVGLEFDAQVSALNARGYPAQVLDAAAVSAMEPALANPPKRAVFTSHEGACDAAGVARKLLVICAEHGAQVLSGMAVQAINVADHGPQVVTTQQGDIQCDRVVVAVGAATPDLLAPLGITVPMASKRGLILHSQPQARLITRAIMSRDVHFRQCANGRFVIGEIFSGDLPDQADLPDLAADIMRRLAVHLPSAPPVLGQICAGVRPVPQDGFPVIDHHKNLSFAVMHSGVTLGPLVGQIIAAEILEGMRDPRLAEFRLDRFRA